MISKHVDIIAIVALLTGIWIYSEVRQSAWFYLIRNRPHLRVEQISVGVPEPPAVPIVFK